MSRRLIQNPLLLRATPMQTRVENDRMGGDGIRVDAALLAAMRCAAEQYPLWTLRIVANDPPPRPRLLDMHSTIGRNYQLAK